MLNIELKGIGNDKEQDEKQFPENERGLENGTKLKPTFDMPWFGLEKGQEISIYWDGKFIRCGGLTWDIETLSKEIDNGFWEMKE